MVPVMAAIVVTASFQGRKRGAGGDSFQVEGLRRWEEMRTDLTDLVGWYKFRPGSHSVTKKTRPVLSPGRKTWTHFANGQAGWEEKEIRLPAPLRPLCTK